MKRGIGRFIRQNAIALLALFLALGGTSFAAAGLINGSQIKPHTIAKNRLTNTAIAQLKGNRGQRGVQGTPGTRGPTGPQGVQGAQGAQGAQGVQGVQGTQGPPGPVNLDYETGSQLVQPGGDGLVQIPCPVNMVATGGGVMTDPASSAVTISESDWIDWPNPPFTANAWEGRAHNGGTSAVNLIVDVICTSPDSISALPSAAARRAHK